MLWATSLSGYCGKGFSAAAVQQMHNVAPRVKPYAQQTGGPRTPKAAQNVNSPAPRKYKQAEGYKSTVALSRADVTKQPLADGTEERHKARMTSSVPAAFLHYCI